MGCLSASSCIFYLDQHPNKKIRENSAMAPSSKADFNLSMLHSTHAWLQRGCIEISGTGPVPRIESEEHGSIAFKWAISLRFRIPQTLHFTLSGRIPNDLTFSLVGALKCFKSIWILQEYTGRSNGQIPAERPPTYPHPVETHLPDPR